MQSSLEQQDDTNVHDRDYRHGVWTAKAENAACDGARLQIDRESGRVIGGH